MELATVKFLPGDPRLVDHIVGELKSQGIFDRFRKECIADVDTKPAYQNLRQRVEGNVSSFLNKQRWKPDMNKNHTRELLRRNIQEPGFLETGVERIVDQVVNPKIKTTFFPQVEEVVYKFLGLEKPSKDKNHTEMLSIDTTDLLPTDLDPISPASDKTHIKPELKQEVKEENLDDSSKIDDDESPPFEPIGLDSSFQAQDENSVDSHLSGISGLTSHGSRSSTPIDNSFDAPEISNADSQISKISSNSRLSIVTCDDKNTPDINDKSFELDAIKKEIENGLKIETENNLEMSNEIIDALKIEVKTEDAVEEPKNDSIKDDVKKEMESQENGDTKENVEKKVEEKKKSDRSRKDSESKHRSRDRDDKKYDKNRHSSSSSKSRDREKRDKHYDKSKDSKKETDEKSKTGKDETKDSKEKSSSKSKDVKDSKYKSKDDKSKDKYKDSKSKIKESVDDKSKSKSSTGKDDRKHSSSSSSNKDRSKSSKDKSSHDKDEKKKDVKKSAEKDRSHSSSKHSLHRSSSSHEKKDSSKKDSTKRLSKDEHCSSKSKSSDSRRSTDRDSNDGASGSSSQNSNTQSLNQSSKIKEITNEISSGSHSGESGGQTDINERHDDVPLEVATRSPVKLNICDSEEINLPVKAKKRSLEKDCLDSSQYSTEVSEDGQIHVKLKKPKFASNIFEARRLMKVRKRLDKLQRKREKELNTALDNENLMNGIKSKLIVDDTDSCSSQNSSKEPEVKASKSPTKSKSEDSKIIYSDEEEDCLYFSPKPSPTEERFLKQVASLELTTPSSPSVISEISEKINSSCSMMGTRRSRKPNMRYCSDDYASEASLLEHEQLPSAEKKGKVARGVTLKRKAGEEIIDEETDNNNVKAIKDEREEKDEKPSTTPSTANLSEIKPVKQNKGKKSKQNRRDSFILPPSPESDVSASSGELQKVSNVGKENQKNAAKVVKATQRYSSDDLYKPRPVIGTTRRSRAAQGQNN